MSTLYEVRTYDTRVGHKCSEFFTDRRLAETARNTSWREIRERPGSWVQLFHLEVTPASEITQDMVRRLIASDSWGSHLMDEDEYLAGRDFVLETTQLDYRKVKEAEA